MLDTFQDHWRIKCSYCGETEDRLITLTEARATARNHFRQHRILEDARVDVLSVRYIIDPEEIRALEVESAERAQEAFEAEEQNKLDAIDNIDRPW